MNYAYIIENGYIVGTCSSNYQMPNSVTEQDINNIQKMFLTKPTAPSEYDYRLKADSLEWELYELPKEEEEPNDT